MCGTVVDALIIKAHKSFQSLRLIGTYSYVPFYYSFKDENMRRVMTDELIGKCYSIAKKMFENQLTQKEGVDLLVKNNMNKSSASIYIDVYCNFRKGTLFDRTIN